MYIEEDGIHRRPVRKPIRLKGYDYNQNGAYFITICTQKRHEILGTVESVGGGVHSGIPFVKLTEYGEITKTFIENISELTPSIIVASSIIMPNHVHLVLIVRQDDEKNNGTPRQTNSGTPRAASPTKALVPKVINALKGLSSKEAGFSMWQRSFHDHIIRDEADYDRIVNYIENNPATWEQDCHFIAKNDCSVGDAALGVPAIQRTNAHQNRFLPKKQNQ